MPTNGSKLTSQKPKSLKEQKISKIYTVANRNTYCTYIKKNYHEGFEYLNTIQIKT